MEQLITIQIHFDYDAGPDIYWDIDEKAEKRIIKILEQNHIVTRIPSDKPEIHYWNAHKKEVKNEIHTAEG